MKKFIIILFILVIFSGCTAKVNVKVLKDNSVSETVIISQDKSNYSKDIDIESIVNNYLKIYKDSLTGYKYEDISTDNMIMFKLNKKYNDIYSYFKESIFIKNNTEDLSYEDINDTYKVSANINIFECGKDCFEPPLIDELNITINSNNIIYNNANQASGNKYIWNLNSLSNQRNINFTMKKSNKYIFTSNTSFFKMSVLIFIGIFILILIALILYKKYKKTRIKF